jgi:diguanylate cyclase (GGDEF)-like protein
MMMDVDDFKGVNDQHGHATGDETLRRIAAILRRNTRKGIDIPGRWGGDEFLVVFGDTDMATARMIAERIRRLVAELPLPDGEGFVTTSIGVVAATPEDTADRLFRRADAALYDAKLSQGKNQVVVHEMS